MRNKDFAELAQRLLLDLSGFIVKAPLMFISPIKHILRGICFESHSYDAKLFYVWVFIQPLCVPTKHVSFNLGKRIQAKGAERWNADAPNLIAELGSTLKREALPFLSRIQSLRDLAAAATSSQESRDPYVQQAIAYALARAGDAGKANTALNQLMRLLDSKVLWQREMAKRAESLKDMLLRNPTEAQNQLEDWEEETAKNLGIEKFTSSVIGLNHSF